MIKHKIMLDETEYSSKPQDAGKLTNRFKKNIEAYTKELSSKELAAEVIKGKTFIPASLKSISNDGFLSQGYFALDFDSGIPFNSVLEKLDNCGLSCTFAYSTFSSTVELPKFRVVFQLEETITCINRRNSIQYALMTLFSRNSGKILDKACKDVRRMFYGGKNLLYENYAYCLDLPRLMIEVASDYTASSKPGNVSRDLNRLNKKIVEFDGMKNGSSYIIYNSELHIPSKANNKNQLLKVDKDFLSLRVRILADLVDGKWLRYPQYFGLVTNLIYLCGGISLYKKSLDVMIRLNGDKPEFQEALVKSPGFLEKLYKLPSVVKFYNYHPEKLANFSPYEEDHVYSNLVHAARKFEVVRVKEYQTIPLSEAEQKFNNLFKSVIETDDTNIHVFKVSTGLGKTKKLETFHQALIALPNHDLKNQVANRMKVPVKVTPELPSDLPSEVKEEIDYYFSIGAIKEAHRFIAKEAKVNFDLANYQRQLKNAYASEVTVVTTHTKALFITFSNLKTAIFDEDPIHSLLSNGSTTVNDLVNLRGKIDNEADKEALGSLISSIINGIKNCPLETSKIGFQDFQAIEKEVLCNGYRYQGNVLAFFNSDWYVVDAYETSTIHFMKRNLLIKK